MDADLDTLAIALYARIDDTLKDRPELAPWRPKVGIAPKLSDAELLTLAVMQVLLGHANETGWLRYAGTHLSHLFPYLPGQAGYNKRLRKSADAVAGDDPAARRRHRRVGRRHLADRLDADRVRPVPAHRATFEPGWLGRLRLLRVALPLLLGAAAAPRVHPGRAADHVRLGQPESRRTRRRHRPVRRRTRPARRSPRSRRSSPTRDTPRPSSSVDSPNTASNSSARPAPTSPAAAAHPSCDASARSSNRSTTP